MALGSIHSFWIFLTCLFHPFSTCRTRWACTHGHAQGTSIGVFFFFNNMFKHTITHLDWMYRWSLFECCHLAVLMLWIAFKDAVFGQFPLVNWCQIMSTPGWNWICGKPNHPPSPTAYHTVADTRSFKPCDLQDRVTTHRFKKRTSVTEWWTS